MPRTSKGRQSPSPENDISPASKYASSSIVQSPHIRLYAILAYTTAARNTALLGLRWDRCDFEAGRIDLRDPGISTPHKGRAIVPMLRTTRAALLEARQGALTDWVIEWAGKPVKSVKRGLRDAAKRAGLEHVSPHDLRRLPRSIWRKMACRIKRNRSIPRPFE